MLPRMRLEPAPPLVGQKPKTYFQSRAYLPKPKTYLPKDLPASDPLSIGRGCSLPHLNAQTLHCSKLSRSPPPTHGGLRTFHQKSTCLHANNVRALRGANLITPPPKSGGDETSVIHRVGGKPGDSSGQGQNLALATGLLRMGWGRGPKPESARDPLILLSTSRSDRELLLLLLLVSSSLLLSSMERSSPKVDQR